MSKAAGPAYVPALRFAALTRLYDPIVRVTTREHRFRSDLLRHAGVQAGERVLDVACGTGSLIALASAYTSRAEFVGIDRDQEILDRARTKGALRKPVCGDATMLPFAGSSFDHVFATLMLHHIDDGALVEALAEVRRVIRPGGLLHVADWRRGTNVLMRSAFTLVRLLDGFDHTDRHAHGTLTEILGGDSSKAVEEWQVLNTPLGSIGLATVAF